MIGKKERSSIEKINIASAIAETLEGEMIKKTYK